MKRCGRVDLSALLFFVSFGVCFADEGGALRPDTVPGLSGPTLMEASQVTLTPAEEKQARWQRDAVPLLRPFLDQPWARKYFGPHTLDQLRRTLAQIPADSGQGVPTPPPQGPRQRVELTLPQSIAIALSKNLDVRIAGLTTDDQRLDIPIAKARFHPTVGLSATHNSQQSLLETAPEFKANAQRLTAFINQQLPTGGSLVLSDDLLRTEVHPQDQSTLFSSTLKLTLTQPLFRGGWLTVGTRAIKDAEFNANVATAQLQAQVLTVIAATKSAYYNAILSEKVIDVTEAAIQRDKTLVEASRALFQAGLVTLRDVYSADLVLATDSARLAGVKANLELANNALLEVLGLPIETEVVLLDKDIGFLPIALDLERWIAVAMKNRPEILAFKDQLEQSSLNIKVARNALLPQLDLVASYGRGRVGLTTAASFDVSGQVWEAGIVFSVPVGNVAAKSALAKAEIEDERLQQQLSQTKRRIEVEVRSAVVKLHTSVEKMKSLTAAVDLASSKLEVARARFALGQATNFDITDAQTALLNAETDLLTAMVDYNVGLAELEARVGGRI